MISYYLVDPDQDSSKYQKLGEIAESKFKNLGNGKEGSLKKRYNWGRTSSSRK